MSMVWFSDKQCTQKLWEAHALCFIHFRTCNLHSVSRSLTPCICNHPSQDIFSASQIFSTSKDGKEHQNFVRILQLCDAMPAPLWKQQKLMQLISSDYVISGTRMKYSKFLLLEPQYSRLKHNSEDCILGIYVYRPIGVTNFLDKDGCYELCTK